MVWEWVFSAEQDLSTIPVHILAANSPLKYMGLSFQPKYENWFLRMCRHIVIALSKIFSLEQ
jgi:hypothetical protein